jgi:hypothetical protein
MSERLRFRREVAGILPGVPRYAAEDLALVHSAADVVDQRQQATLLAGALPVQFDIQTHRLLYPWGYCPASNWGRNGHPAPGASVQSAVQVYGFGERAPESGISYTVEGNFEPVSLNEATAFLTFGQWSQGGWLQFAGDSYVALDAEGRAQAFGLRLASSSVPRRGRAISRVLPGVMKLGNSRA